MRRGGPVCTALIAVALACASGCKKENESLILVRLTADSRAGSLTTLTLSAPGARQAFTIAGLSATAMEFGLYVPEAVTGEVTVTASASGATGCAMGYSGRSATLTISAAGATVGPTSILMMPANVCGTSGTAGSGGAAGAGGNSGGAGTTGTGGTGTVGCTGTSPPPGTPPALTCCREYDHEDNCSFGAYVYTVAFTPDGATLMTGGDDGRIKLWAFDGKTLTGGLVMSGAGYGYGTFSPDGKLVAVGMSSGEVDVWSLSALMSGPTNKLTSSSITNYGVAFTPDSQRVISIDDGSLNIHSLANNQLLATVLSPVSNYALAVSPTAVSGGAVGIGIAGSDSYAAVYNLSAQGTVASPVVLHVTVNEVLSAAFSPTSTLLALGDYDAVARFWTYPVPSATAVPTGANITIDPVHVFQTVAGLAFSPNGSYLAIAAGYPGDVSIWNVASRTEVSRYALSTYNGLSVAFSPSGNAVVVGEKGCGKILLCTE